MTADSTAYAPQQLFPDRTLTDDSPRRRTERLYPFLSRSSWRVSERARALCENWFSRYPINERERADLYGRFTSFKDEDHRAAYFELLLHELLFRLGGTVTIHPTVPETDPRPDFLVEIDGRRFYLEAMVSHASDSSLPDDPIFDTVCDWIDEMDLPDHYLNIFFSDVPTRMPKRRSIHEQVEQLIHESDPRRTRRGLTEDMYLTQVPGFIEIADAYARVSLLPRTGSEQKGPNRRNVLRSGGGALLDLAPRWHDAIRRKAKSKEIQQYDAPCVIAVDVLDGFAKIGREGVRAVYGFRSNSVPQRGLWKSTDDGSWRDNLAAVWMFNFAEPVQASPSGVEDCLLLSPSVEQPLPTRLTELTHVKSRDNKLKWFDGLDLDDLLNVPEIPYEELRHASPSGS